MSSRTVVQSEQFIQERTAVGLQVPRLAEIVEGVIWALKRDPRRFPQVRGTRLHRVVTDPFPNAPSVRIWYTYNILHQEVELLSIERVDRDSDQRLAPEALTPALNTRDPAVFTGPEPAA